MDGNKKSSAIKYIDDIFYFPNKYSNKNVVNFFVDKRGDCDTPFFVVNLKEIERPYNKFIRSLPKIKPYYAIKCNSDIRILEKLVSLGCNFHCSSKKEIKTILKLINDPSRILYDNPCKSISYIEYAKKKNVQMMTFDCLEELYKIYDYYHNAKMILRLSDDEKIGCKIDNIQKIFNEIKRIGANLHGISFKSIKDPNNPKTYYNNLFNCRYVYDIAKYNYGFSLKIIDISADFSETRNAKISFTDFADNISLGITEFFGKIINDIEFITNIDRFFTEFSYILVVNVILKKKTEGVIKYYINDGIYGSFGCIGYNKQKYEIKILDDRIVKNKFNSSFHGPTNSYCDIICEDIMFPVLSQGEWLYIENFGAYSESFSTFFNGYKTKIKYYIYK